MSNKIVFVPARTGQAYWVMGDLFTYLVTGEESGGNYFTLEVNVGPGHGPPPHIHHREEEQFYVLEGELTFRVGDQTLQASPGDFVHIPRDTVHSFKNGPTPAKLFSTFSPAGIEQFFKEVGDPVEDRTAPPPPVTEATIARLAAAESRGWKEHHETLPPPVTKGTYVRVYWGCRKRVFFGYHTATCGARHPLRPSFWTTRRKEFLSLKISFRAN